MGKDEEGKTVFEGHTEMLAAIRAETNQKRDEGATPIEMPMAVSAPGTEQDATEAPVLDPTRAIVPIEREDEGFSKTEILMLIFAAITAVTIMASVYIITRL